MAENDDRAAIEAKVRSLAQGVGLQRRALAQSLGYGIRRLWGIYPGLQGDKALNVVGGKLIPILESVPDASLYRIKVQVGRLLYNISPLTERRRFSLTDRQKCLDAEFRAKHGLSKLDFARGKSSVANDAREIYNYIADTLLNEWRQVAPGEPFPTDAALGDIPSQHGDGDTSREPAGDDSPSTEAQDDDRHDNTAAVPVEDAEPLPVQVEPDVPLFDTESSVRPFWRRHRKVAVTTLAVIVVAGITVGAVELSRSGGGAAVPKSGEVVHVDSVVYTRDGTGKADGWSYVMPQKVALSSSDLANVGRLENDRSSYENWMTGHGGVTPDDATIQIVLSNPTSHAITIADMDVVKQCEKPLSGTLFWSPPQGATGDTLITFNLDDRVPVAKDSQTGASYFAGQSAHTIQLSPNEITTLQLDATSTRSYCQFHFNLKVDPGDGGSIVTQSVYDHGKPFAVTAVPSAGGEPRFANYEAVYVDETTPNGFGEVDPVTYH